MLALGAVAIKKIIGDPMSKRSVKLYNFNRTRQIGFFEESQADTPLFSGCPQIVKDQKFNPEVIHKVNQINVFGDVEQIDPKK